MLSNEDRDDTPILSQYSENIIVDAFTFYLDRTNDINLIQLNSVDIDSALSNSNHSMPSATHSLHSDHNLAIDSPRSNIS